jgi:hypothetical protein
MGRYAELDCRDIRLTALTVKALQGIGKSAQTVNCSRVSKSCCSRTARALWDEPNSFASFLKFEHVQIVGQRAAYFLVQCTDRCGS